MITPTEADRERALRVLGYGPLALRSYLSDEYARIEGVAAALAEERAKARAPFLALAQEITEAIISDEAQAARLDEWGFPASAETNRDGAREKRFYVDRIRRAAGLTE